MAETYSSLQVSPRKKRCPPSPDDNMLTPKKLRTAPLTPPTTQPRRGAKPTVPLLPPHLARLLTIQTGIQRALTHALATAAVSPSETGSVCNVLNNYSLTKYSGLSTTFSIDDLKRLCWVWEWDAKEVPPSDGFKGEGEEDNPFLEDDPDALPRPKEWSRQGMGFVVTPTTHNLSGKRVPAYGIGIEVELDMDKEMSGGIAAVARWTAASQTRRDEVKQKLEKWMELHHDQCPVPSIPLADLPHLPTVAAKPTVPGRSFISSPTKLNATVPATPRSPVKSPQKSPAKRNFIIPSVPVTPSTPRVGRGIFPQTPASSSSSAATTPRPKSASFSSDSEEDPSTPTIQRGRVPETPTTARRQALYDRIRQRSQSTSPTKQLGRALRDSPSKEQMRRLGQEEIRRRCLLGRLGGVAESVYMLFSTPSTAITSTPSRKRRAIPISEVAPAIVKSSPVPISLAEAQESLKMLTELCPFFLRSMMVAGAEWLEMPASTNNAPRSRSCSGADEDKVGPPSTPTKKTRKKAPTSPSSSKVEEELINRSPRRVKNESGGLREVREIIRRELELQD